MKKYISILSMAVLLLLVASCQVEVEGIQEKLDSKVPADSYKVTAHFQEILEEGQQGGGAQGKGIGAGYSFSFAPEENLSVFSGSGAMGASIESADGLNAHYTGAGFGLVEGRTYYSVYPGKAQADYTISGSTTSVRHVYTGQHQSVNGYSNAYVAGDAGTIVAGSYDHLSAYDYNVASGTAHDGEIDFTYDRKTAFITLDLSFNESILNAQKVYIMSDNKDLIVGWKETVSTSGGEPDFVPTYSSVLSMDVDGMGNTDHIIVHLAIGGGTRSSFKVGVVDEYGVVETTAYFPKYTYEANKHYTRSVDSSYFQLLGRTYGQTVVYVPGVNYVQGPGEFCFDPNANTYAGALAVIRTNRSGLPQTKILSEKKLASPGLYESYNDLYCLLEIDPGETVVLCNTTGTPELVGLHPDNHYYSNNRLCQFNDSMTKSYFLTANVPTSSATFEVCRHVGASFYQNGSSHYIKCETNHCEAKLFATFYDDSESETRGLSLAQILRGVDRSTFNYNYYAPGYHGGITAQDLDEGRISSYAFYNSTMVAVKVPETFTTINNNAFTSCTHLEEVILPDTITRIDRSAFSGCTSLRKINIPASVTTLSENVFFRCESLAEIAYGGTLAQWSAMASQNNWNYGMSDSAVVVCSDVCINAMTGQKVACSHPEHQTIVVSFDKNGGRGMMMDVVAHGSYILPDSTFEPPAGKVFTGWSLTADGPVIAESSINVAADTVLYAKWKDGSQISTASELRHALQFAGNYALAADITGHDFEVIANKTSSSAGKKTITLDLNGHTIDAQGEGRIFNLTKGEFSSHKVMTITNSQAGVGGLINGRATSSNGGAIYIGQYCDLEISGFTIRNCTAVSTYGGAIYAVGTVKVTDVIFVECSSIRGGAIYVYGGTTLDIYGTVNFTDCTAIGENGDGGAIYSVGDTKVKDGAVLDIGSTDSTNKLARNGGGICLASGGSVAIEGAGRLNMHGLKAGDGGALCMLDSASINATLKNTTIENCSATSNGGAIYVTLGSLSFDGSNTISGCTANQRGGAIYSNGTLVLNGGNEIADCSADSSSGAIFANSGSLTLAGTESQRIEISRCSTSGNDAAAIYVGTSVSSCSIAYTTFTGKGLEESVAGHGGALYLAKAASLNNVIIQDCYTTDTGAGIWVNADLTLTDVTFSRCKSDSLGGGIYIKGGLTTIAGASSFFECISASRGAAIACNGGSVTVGGATSITNCEANQGTGIDLGGSGKTATLKDNASITNCVARGSSPYGVGVRVGGGNTLIMQDNASITGNTCYNHGGAVQVDNSSTLSLQGTVQITGNKHKDNNEVEVGDVNVRINAGAAGIVVTGALTGSANIGVTVTTVPTAETPVALTAGALPAGAEDFFHSDSASYAVERLSGDPDVLQLVVVPQP